MNSGLEIFFFPFLLFALKPPVPVFIRTKKAEDGRERWRKALHAARQRSSLKRLLVKCRCPKKECINSCDW
jgi:hypothetical protein